MPPHADAVPRGCVGPASGASGASCLAAASTCAEPRDPDRPATEHVRGSRGLSFSSTPARPLRARTVKTWAGGCAGARTTSVGSRCRRRPAATSGSALRPARRQSGAGAATTPRPSRSVSAPAPRHQRDGGEADTGQAVHEGEEVVGDELVAVGDPGVGDPGQEEHGRHPVAQHFAAVSNLRHTAPLLLSTSSWERYRPRPAGSADQPLPCGQDREWLAACGARVPRGWARAG